MNAWQSMPACQISGDDVFSPDVKTLINNSQAALGLEQLPPLVFASDRVVVHTLGEQSFLKTYLQ